MKRKKDIRTTIIVVLVIILLASCGIGFYLYKIWMQTENIRVQLQKELDSNTQTVYVANGFIKAGEKLTASGPDANVHKETIRSGLEAFNYMSDEQLGSIACVDIVAGLPIMNALIYEDEITQDERIVEVSTVNIMVSQTNYDYVDVRITFPNGEDYLVLSKKCVDNLDFNNCIWTTRMNEEENLRMNSAIIDAFLVSGTRLYTVEYVESNLQAEAIPNYLVKAEVQDIINSDPNVLTKAYETLNLAARMDLEARLGYLTKEELDAVTEGWGLADTAKSAVLGGRNEEVISEPNNFTDENIETVYGIEQ